MRIDFQDLKSTIGIEKIIAWLAIDLKKTGTHQIRGVCPIHGGTNDRQFVVSTDKNLWHCFGDCNGGGDIIELVARMQKVSQKQAAEMIAAHFMATPSPPVKKLEPIDYLDEDQRADAMRTLRNRLLDAPKPDLKPGNSFGLSLPGRR